MTVVDASNGVSAYGATAADAYSSLIAGETGTAPAILGGNSTTTNESAVLQTVVSAFTSRGYSVETPSLVNVNIGNQVGSFNLTSVTGSQVNQTVKSFISQYATNTTIPIYEWQSGNNGTNFGVIKNENGIVVSYYLTATSS